MIETSKFIEDYRRASMIIGIVIVGLLFCFMMYHGYKMIKISECKEYNDLAFLSIISHNNDTTIYLNKTTVCLSEYNRLW